MPGYGLPKGTKGLLPWRWAEQRLTKSHNYWITTVKADGSPHTMVVWGLWRNGTFLFSTGRQSRKSRNLEKNRDCVVCTELAREAVSSRALLRKHPMSLFDEISSSGRNENTSSTCPDLSQTYSRRKSQSSRFVLGWCLDWTKRGRSIPRRAGGLRTRSINFGTKFELSS